jgi:hypothetical protein
MGKTIVVRKDHPCNACDGTIKKGEKAIFYEGKGPRFDDNDKQIGIEYWKVWMHPHNCSKPESCKEGEHVWCDEYTVETYPEDETPTGNKICENCYDIKIIDS